MAKVQGTFNNFVLLHLNGNPVYFQVKNIVYIAKKENSKHADIYLKGMTLFKVDESFEEIADLLGLEYDNIKEDV